MANKSAANPYLCSLENTRHTLTDSSGGPACLYLHVNGKVTVVKIDGGLVTGSVGKRCDYLIESSTNERTWLVELKGIDSDTACEQISETVMLLKTNPDLMPYNVKKSPVVW